MKFNATFCAIFKYTVESFDISLKKDDSSPEIINKGFPSFEIGRGGSIYSTPFTFVTGDLYPPPPPLAPSYTKSICSLTGFVISLTLTQSPFRL